MCGIRSWGGGGGGGYGGHAGSCLTGHGAQPRGLSLLEALLTALPAVQVWFSAAPLTPLAPSPALPAPCCSLLCSSRLTGPLSVDLCRFPSCGLRVMTGPPVSGAAVLQPSGPHGAAGAGAVAVCLCSHLDCWCQEPAPVMDFMFLSFMSSQLKLSSGCFPVRGCSARPLFGVGAVSHLRGGGTEPPADPAGGLTSDPCLPELGGQIPLLYSFSKHSC